MKVLGILFDNNMNWEPQVQSCTKKCAKLTHALRYLRRHLNNNQMRQVTTSFLFSVLMYGSEVWYHKHLSFNLKQRIRSTHYKALRITYGRKLSRDQIDQKSTRATPDEWSNGRTSPLQKSSWTQSSINSPLDSINISCTKVTVKAESQDTSICLTQVQGKLVDSRLKTDYVWCRDRLNLNGPTVF